MPTINGVINQVSDSPIVINGGKTTTFNGLRPHLYDKWRMNWNGNMFAPPESGSVLYLPGYPAQGSTIKDFSGSGNDGTITGATWTRTGAGLWYLDYDGGNDYTFILDSVTGGHSFTGLSDNITLIAWVEPDAIVDAGANWYPAYVVIELRTETSAGTHVPFCFGIESSKISLGVTDNHLTNDERVQSSTNLTVDAWQQIAVTISGDDYIFYLNGIADGNGTFSTSTGDRSVGATICNLIIGVRTGNTGSTVSGQSFDGAIALLPVFGTTLSASQIASIYNQERHLFGV